MKAIDMTGRRYGRLTAIRPQKRRDSKSRSAIYWLCHCDCGAEKVVSGNALRRGAVRSCGCFNAERRVERGTKHGLAGSRIYNTWCNMNARCTNKELEAYKNYGARGITVCDRWKTFVNFRADVGDPPSEMHSLDRIDCNGNYEPGNVRWALPTMQARNKRDTIFVEISGRRMSLADAAEKYGIAYDTLHNRVRDGKWTAEQAVGLTAPPKRGGYKWGEGKRRRRFSGAIVYASRER